MTISGVTTATLVVCANCGNVLGIEGYYRNCTCGAYSNVKFILVVVPLG